MITHKGTKTLYTKRLILRHFTVEDAADMYKNWASSEEVTRFLTWQPHSSPEATKYVLGLWCSDYEKPDTYNWAIEYEERPIGSIGVVRFDTQSEHAELGYCMGTAFWNRGLMSEAAQAVIDYLFAEVSVNRIGISHAVKNPASGRVAQKCGLTYEGTKRAYFKSNAGEFLDISDYGILRSDWELARRNAL
ncbi:MAG: GNAT family N-acetyltransferase [Clostridia bacterium]|nr:GNAT family N-acetyltransferase [Clostridia bacterium]